MTARTDQASRFELELLRRVHDVAPHPWGWVVREPSLPLVHGSNLLWVDVRDGVGGETLADEVRALGLARVRVEDDALGLAVAPALKDAGLRTERLVRLALRRLVPVVPPDGVTLAEATPAQAVAAWQEDWGQAGLAPDAEAQLVEVRRRQVAAGGRAFVADATAAHCSLFLGDGIAQVEDVYTVPQRRRRGLASALITRAVQAAPPGAEIVMLAEPHAVSVYERLGFAVSGHCWEATAA